MNYERRLMELIRIEEERNLILKEMESILGFDISFSDSNLRKNALDVLTKEIMNDLEKTISGVIIDG
tara:strand:- start:6 stop:206 length:201 start_codon:yes stop_codon:yes gene_type:complete